MITQPLVCESRNGWVNQAGNLSWPPTTWIEEQSGLGYRVWSIKRRMSHWSYSWPAQSQYPANHSRNIYRIANAKTAFQPGMRYNFDWADDSW